MSVFGSMTTAVTGLAAQARALGNLSDNIANSQTIGYKRVETSFQQLVTLSNANVHSPGGVRAKPAYTNSLQGNITQTESTTNMALSGNGFFQVSRGTEDTGGVDFQSTPYYTRAGDFSLDRFGYLRNTAGMYLNGWGLDAAGGVNRGNIEPIRIQQLIDTPTATQNIDLSANLPMKPTKANLDTQTITIIDDTGVERELQLNWRQQAAGDWRLSVNAPGSTSAVTGGSLPSSIDPLTAIGTPFVALNGSPATQQVTDITINAAQVFANTEYSLTINNQTVTYKASEADETNPDNVLHQLWSRVSDSNAAPGGASFAAGTITLRGDTDGHDMDVRLNPSAAFSWNNVPDAVLGIKEEIYLPVGGPAGNVGDVYTVDWAGSPTITYTTDGTEANAKTLAERIAAKINADGTSPVTASVSGAGLKLVAKVADNASVVPTTTVTAGSMPAHVHLKFDGGYLKSMDTANVGSGTATTPPSQNSGDAAYIEFVVNYGNGPQTVKLNLGKFGEKDAGLTQFDGTNLETYTQTQDGFTRGAFQNLEIKASGDVVANYDNGRSRVLARVPVIQVTNPDAMQKVAGNALAMTREAGGVRADDAGANGAANLAVSSVEGSNVDIAQEFTKMIVTQRAYSANTKVVSASDEMLQETLGMKR